MSRHALNPEHYTSQATFELERERLFGRLWTFVGFASMVAEKNRFFTRKVAGVPVLVQRTEAGIRAFLNQCPHRHLRVAAGGYSLHEQPQAAGASCRVAL